MDYPDRPWLASYPADLAPEIPDVPFDTVAEFAVSAMRRWQHKPAFSNMGTTRPICAARAASPRATESSS